jgi:hypothetical protein
MNAIEIVDRLLETDADEFVSSLPVEFWDTFHFVRDGEHSIHADDNHSGQVIVYRNSEDGTRDFIGYIDDTNINRPGKWVLAGYAKPRPGSPTLIRPVNNGRAYDSKEEAAKELSVIYRYHNSR